MFRPAIASRVVPSFVGLCGLALVIGCQLTRPTAATPTLPPAAAPAVIRTVERDATDYAGADGIPHLAKGMLKPLQVTAR